MYYDKRVSIVFPAYDEAENVARAVAEFAAVEVAAGARLVDDIIVVDNNSTDGTAALAREAGAIVVSALP